MTTATTPYQTAPDRAFWRHAVSTHWDERGLSSETALIRKGERVMSAGSCFASNLIPYLERAGFPYVRVGEYGAPLDEWAADHLGYATFSARYGNVYTARQASQLLQRALGEFKPVEDRWQGDDGTVIDAFRPGLKYPAANDAEFEAITASHLASVREAVTQANVFIFTLGLTEAWLSTTDAAVFPSCPGTIGGTFDPQRHRFHNFNVEETVADLRELIGLGRRINPDLRFILTVSPVPLVATATQDHVLVATTYSKAVLRAAATTVVSDYDNVLYFPSYEIVAGPQAPASYFEADRRNVSVEGVRAVMRAFLDACETDVNIDETEITPSAMVASIGTDNRLSQVIAEAECEEEALDPEFVRRKAAAAASAQTAGSNQSETARVALHRDADGARIDLLNTMLIEVEARVSAQAAAIAALQQASPGQHVIDQTTERLSGIERLSEALRHEIRGTADRADRAQQEFVALTSSLTVVRALVDDARHQLDATREKTIEHGLRLAGTDEQSKSSADERRQHDQALQQLESQLAKFEFLFSEKDKTVAALLADVATLREGALRPSHLAQLRNETAERLSFAVQEAKSGSLEALENQAAKFQTIESGLDAIHNRIQALDQVWPAITASVAASRVQGEAKLEHVRDFVTGELKFTHSHIERLEALLVRNQDFIKEVETKFSAAAVDNEKLQERLIEEWREGIAELETRLVARQALPTGTGPEVAPYQSADAPADARAPLALEHQALRITAVNAALARRSLEIQERLDRLAQDMLILTESASLRSRANSDAASLEDRVPAQLVDTPIHTIASDTTLPDTTLPVVVPQLAASLVTLSVTQEAGRPRRTIRHESRSTLIDSVAEPFFSLRDNPSAQDLVNRGLRLQVGNIWLPGEIRDYHLASTGNGLGGADLAFSFLIHPTTRMEVFSVALLDDNDHVIREVVCEIDAASPHVPTPLRFPPVDGFAGQPVRLRFTALPSVATLGVRLYEWRSYSLIRRRIRQQYLFARPHFP